MPDLQQLARDSGAPIACAADPAEGLIDASVLDALGPRAFRIDVARGRLGREADPVPAPRERPTALSAARPVPRRRAGATP